MDLTLMSAGVSTHPATFAAAVKLPGIVRINPRVKLVFEPPEKRTAYGSSALIGANYPNSATPFV